MAQFDRKLAFAEELVATANDFIRKLTDVSTTETLELLEKQSAEWGELNISQLAISCGNLKYFDLPVARKGESAKTFAFWCLALKQSWYGNISTSTPDHNLIFALAFPPLAQRLSYRQRPEKSKKRRHRQPCIYKNWRLINFMQSPLVTCFYTNVFDVFMLFVFAMNIFSPLTNVISSVFGLLLVDIVATVRCAYLCFMKYWHYNIRLKFFILIVERIASRLPRYLLNVSLPLLALTLFTAGQFIDISQFNGEGRASHRINNWLMFRAGYRRTDWSWATCTSECKSFGRSQFIRANWAPQTGRNCENRHPVFSHATDCLPLHSNANDFTKRGLAAKERILNQFPQVID